MGVFDSFNISSAFAPVKSVFQPFADVAKSIIEPIGGVLNTGSHQLRML